MSRIGILKFRIQASKCDVSVANEVQIDSQLGDKEHLHAGSIRLSSFVIP